MLLIGLGHKARQGKNTVAMELVNASPIDQDVRMFAFADALRKEVNTAIRQAHGAANLIEGFQEAGIMPGWVRPEVFPDKQRTLLQWWGTDYRRAKEPNYWVYRLAETLEQLKPDVAVVTDLRFPNEADFIHGLGGYVVKVERTTQPDIVVPEHVSEKALDGYAGWDFILRAATVLELKQRTRELYAEIIDREKRT